MAGAHVLRLKISELKRASTKHISFPVPPLVSKSLMHTQSGLGCVCTRDIPTANLLYCQRKVPPLQKFLHLCLSGLVLTLCCFIAGIQTRFQRGGGPAGSHHSESDRVGPIHVPIPRPDPPSVSHSQNSGWSKCLQLNSIKSAMIRRVGRFQNHAATTSSLRCLDLQFESFLEFTFESFGRTSNARKWIRGCLFNFVVRKNSLHIPTAKYLMSCVWRFSSYNAREDPLKLSFNKADLTHGCIDFVSPVTAVPTWQISTQLVAEKHCQNFRDAREY